MVFNTSILFAGNDTSYLQVPTTSAFSFGTGGFTFEWWQYQTDTNPFPRIFSIGAHPTTVIGVSIESGTFYFWKNGTPTGHSILNYKNTWTHFAISRTSGQTTVFMNGTSIMTISDTNNYNASQPLTIGCESRPQNISAFGGLIYGFRIVSGVGLYTQNFTPSYNLPAVDGNTLLLLSGNNYQGIEGQNVVENNITTDPTIPPNSIGGGNVPCFLEGTNILCLINEEEQYVPIETIHPGHLVKTLKNGFVPVNMIGHRLISNNESDIENRLYKCPTENYPELLEDLYITGYHSILVDKLSDIQREKTIHLLGQVYATDGLRRLLVHLDDKSSPADIQGDVNIWHLALDNDDYYMNYGIYANGLLVESTSKRYMKELSKMELIQ
jgi:Concanavalin A-like lectin/glucanases superfamily/Hint domain